MPPADRLRNELARGANGLRNALEDLVEIARGIHLAVLANGGFTPALQTLARRFPSRPKPPGRQGAASSFVAAVCSRCRTSESGSSEWKLEVQGCALSGRTVHGDRAAERLDAVPQPDQAGAVGRIGSAVPVVTDAEA
jgi:hypothetical protein